MAGSGAAAMTAIAEDELVTMHQFIENALDLKLKGNATNYDFLIQQLTTPGKSDVKTRRKIYLALPRCISTMAKEPHAYQQFLNVLFKFTFLEEREEIEAFTRFIVHLVSSNTVYVLPTLQMLTRNLCRPQQLPPAFAALVAAANAPAAPTAIKRISIGSSFGGITSSSTASAAAPAPAPEPIDVEARIEQRYSFVHETYQRVLALVPTAANILFPVVCEHFPHKRLDAPFQVAYLKNVLKLSTYVPGLQERIFGLIVDQLVAVDVEIKLDEKEEDIFTMDDFLDDELLPPDSSKLDEMADKLDQMMVIMFSHIEEIVGAPASGSESTNADATTVLNVQKAALVFKYLLKVFEHSILNTHRSKYPQFLLFYICRMDPQFQDVLISQLLAASLDPQVPPVTRHSCGAYLASFLARAKYISVAYIQKALYHLLKWMHDQMDVYDAALQPKDPDAQGNIEAEAAELEAKDTRGNFQESIFISTLQTVCYMLCFRGLEIAQTPNGYDFLRTLGWERLLITSTSYCPLAFCQQTVATEFLNFVETFDLISEECIDRVDQAISSSGKGAFKTKTKTMERSKAPSSNASAPSTLLGQRQPLETFFPFDPYLLRRSFKYIGPLYLYWKHADPTSSENCDALNAVKAIIREFEAEVEDDDEEEADEDDDDEEDVDRDDDVSMSGSVGVASFKGLSYLENHIHGSVEQRAYGMSVGSSNDGDYSFDDRDRALKAMASGSKKKSGKKVSRSTFDPSPALSASSPPSRLPPLGSANAFTLGGFDDYEDDDGF